MGRITRAQAAAVADQVHIDDDVFSASTRDETHQLTMTSAQKERAPLAEIEANNNTTIQETDSSESQSDENQRPGKKGKKGGRKGAKNNSQKAANALASSTSTPPNEPLEVVPDEHDSAPSPASRAASDDLMKEQPELDMSHLPVLEDMRPKTPQSSAVRLTRSQLRKVPSVENSAEPKPIEVEIQNQEPAKELTTNEGLQPSAAVETLSANKPAADAEVMPNTVQLTRDISPARLSTPTKTPTKNEMSSGTPYDELEAAVVEAQTPPRSGGKSRSGSQEDPIAAMDALDEAVEKVNAEVPDVQPSPQKKSKKPAPVVRTTKASAARISLAHGPKDAPRVPSWGKPRPSTAFGASTAKRVTSTSSEKSNDGEVAEKKEAVIPHSKPRPMSMSFPAPKAPPKSTKAPTKSNFQLPGEAVAAKLKAAREARLQKEAEDQQKKTFKARPAPAMTKAPTIRQTSTSKARESMIGGKPTVPSTAHKRANSVATTKPKPLGTSKTAGNRMSVVPSNVSTVKVAKRPSTAMASLNKPRPSTAAATTRPVSVISGGSKTATTKGKEVFNRAANNKAAAEKEKREKEEAAKKARAEASERGRQASREWAEKQRLKKLGVKPAPKVDAPASAPEPVAEIETTPEVAAQVPIETALKAIEA